MAVPFLARVMRGDVVISDGATGTYLQRHGLAPGVCPEALNLTAPDTVRQMHTAYFAAGSDLVLTNSFGGNAFCLRRYGLGDQVREVNRLAAVHARSVAPLGRFVIGSIGPTGELLEPFGNLSAGAMLAAFAEQARALADGGVDGILIETMSALEEATLAVRAVREQTDCLVLATMVFSKGRRGWATTMGVTPEQAVRELMDAGAVVVGANCGNGSGPMVELARVLRGLTDGPLLIHANAGIPEMRGGEVVYPETPEVMLPSFIAMHRIGVNVLGGCCGTTPEHIRALCRALRGDALPATEECNGAGW